MGAPAQGEEGVIESAPSQQRSCLKRAQQGRRMLKQPRASLRATRPGRPRLLLLHQRPPPRCVWLPQHVPLPLRLGLLHAALLRHRRHALLWRGEGVGWGVVGRNLQ